MNFQTVFNEFVENRLFETMIALNLPSNNRKINMPKWDTYNNSVTSSMKDELDDKSIILVLAPSSYIYTSNGLVGYASIQSNDNLMLKYKLSKRDSNIWQRKYDRRKNSTNKDDIKRCKFYQKKIQCINSKFDNDRTEFISNLVKQILTQYNKIYIETPPDPQLNIKENGFRNMHYLDMDYCELALKINMYDSFIIEFEDQIESLNESNNVFDGNYKELHLIPEEVTIKCHNYCYHCGSPLLEGKYTNCEDQLLTCPTCGRIIKEYFNMMDNIKAIFPKLNL